MRLIDAEALKKDILKLIGFPFGIPSIEAIINNAPTIEAKPIVHAHWKKWGCEGTVCSNCYGRVLYECDEQEKKSKFCPHCGAQMDEGVKIPVISMEDVPKIMEEMEK